MLTDFSPFQPPRATEAPLSSSSSAAGAGLEQGGQLGVAAVHLRSPGRGRLVAGLCDLYEGYAAS